MANADNLTDYLADETLSLPPQRDVEAAVGQILDLHGRQGGATFGLHFGDVSGQPLFAVSLYPKRTVLVFGRRVSAGVLRRFLRDNAELLDDPRNCVGTWYEEDADETTLDVSTTLADYPTAEALGRRYNQIAIFGLKSLETVVTDGTGVELAGWPPEAERLPPIRRGTTHADR